MYTRPTWKKYTNRSNDVTVPILQAFEQWTGMTYQLDKLGEWMHRCQSLLRKALNHQRLTSHCLSAWSVGTFKILNMSKLVGWPSITLFVSPFPDIIILVSIRHSMSSSSTVQWKDKIYWMANQIIWSC